MIESTEVVPEDTDRETGTREAGPSEDRVVETLRTERADRHSVMGYQRLNQDCWSVNKSLSVTGDSG